MPIPAIHKAPFEEEAFYHVYNRSVSGLKLFSTEENYRYFLQKFHEYLSPVWDVYAFCLLPNHFHFLIKVKPWQKGEGSKPSKGSEPSMRLSTASSLAGATPLHRESIRCFKNFCLSYSLAYKKQMDIKTNVFSQRFKHVLIDKDSSFTQVIFYIHLNPLHHNMKVDWQHYPWSSYQRILKKGVLPGAEHTPYGKVLEWFGGPERYIWYHQQQQPLYECDFDE